MKKIILLALLASSSAFAQEEIQTPTLTTREEKPDREFTPYASHWVGTFGFENMKYPTSYNFQGLRKEFKDSEQDLWGARLGFGGQLYLGAGFATTTRLEGYFLGSAFSKSNTAQPDVDVDYAKSQTAGQIYGGDIVQALSFMFDFKTKNPIMGTNHRLTMEPFVEAGIGVAQAFNRAKYRYQTGSGSGTTVNESYYRSNEDSLTNARIGGGINITSTTGYFFFMKYTQSRFDITNRRTMGKESLAGVETEYPRTKVDAKIDPVTVLSVGGGYKF
jgi:hypothetical protein